MNLKTIAFSINALFVFSLSSTAQLQTADTIRMSPNVLPGSGLTQHDFFYAGENSVLSMYIIEKGKVTWSYTHPGKGEISDATLLSNGDVLFAHQFGVTKISHNKEILWNYDAPAGTEIHTAQAIGKDRVWFLQNGKPAKVSVVNIVTGKTEKEFELPVANPDGVHGQFRHARLTDAGTLMIAHMDMNKIAEYDVNGKEVWSMPYLGPWSAVPLKNGNILCCNGGRNMTVEMSRKGDTVWKCTPANLPGYTFSNVQLAVRLDNGNTIINNWAGKGNGTNAQAVEVTRDKKIVWALRSWDEPFNIGRSTTIQLLDKKIVPENVRFGNIK